MIEKFLIQVSLAGFEFCMFWFLIGSYIFDNLIATLLINMVAVYLFICFEHSIKLNGGHHNFPRKGRFWKDMFVDKIE